MADNTIRDRVTVSPDPAGSRYTLDLDGEVIGFTAYRDLDGRRVFVHTEIDDGYAGHGLSSILVGAALDDIRAAGLRVVAVCPLVDGFVKKREQYADLTDPVTPAILRSLQG